MGDQSGASTAYGTTIGDTQQTVTLISALNDLVGRPLSSFFQRRNAEQSLRKHLGEWVDEAVDASGQWLRPVLTTIAFQNHLVQNDGQFQPSGTCQSTFGWARFLYALDIRPGCGVLSWNNYTNGLDPSERGSISLEIEGEALCHIINIYRIYDISAPSNFSHIDISGASSCRISFGSLSVKRIGQHFACSFQPGTPKELSKNRVPFSYSRPSLGPSDVRSASFEPGLVVVKYLETLLYGISENKAILPPASAPLKERARTLIAARELWEPWRWEQPVLLTPFWLEEASRIKRRITTDGGEDESLIEDIISALQNSTNLRQYLDNSSDGNGWEQKATAILRRCCMFKQKVDNLPDKLSAEELIHGHFFNPIPTHFRSIWFAGSGPSNKTLRIKIFEELPIILSGFRDKGTDCWKRTLSEMVPEVLSLMRMEDLFINLPWLVLELTSVSEMWNATCLIS